MMQRLHRLIAPAVAVAVCAALAGGVAAQESVTDSDSATEAATTIIASPVGEPRPAPELAGLLNADGTPFDLSAFEGSPVLVYFGFTHCPDVCPATIGEIFGVWEEIPDMEAIFITVDPERDTPEFLAEWTRYLPDNFHGVSGSPMAIRRAADNYGARYARVPSESAGGYTMSHTAELYLIDSHGQLLLSYPFGTPAADIIADLALLAAD
jgi:protein SCO1/2